MFYMVLAGALLLLATIWIAVSYARAYEREKIHRWLEAHAREVSENVAEVLGEPLGTDAELLARVRPDSLPETEDGG